MTAGWQLVASLTVAGALLTCRQIGQAGNTGIPAHAPDAATARDAGPFRETAPTSATPPPPPAGGLSPVQCKELRQRVERQLAAAQRCKSDGECEAITFEYAFRPCGVSVKTGAPLGKVAADAKFYRERCSPVIRPVRCPHTPWTVCSRGRCTLTGRPD